MAEEDTRGSLVYPYVRSTMGAMFITEHSPPSSSRGPLGEELEVTGLGDCCRMLGRRSVSLTEHTNLFLKVPIRPRPGTKAAPSLVPRGSDSEMP
ncbi:hypothetical protein SESBI_42355 [Sesbania bispinosa]|nr:hypothetical protein SESBI_42355 [Sesbania bispinosa]